MSAEEDEVEVVERDLIMVVEDEEFEDGGGEVSDQETDGPPSPKKIRTEPADEDDEDGFICLICYCAYTNSGEHRISCLACGHVFGKSCITKWLKSASSCPQCNDKARRKDIRVLYTKHLKALDTTERDRALQELEIAKQAKQAAELELSKLKLVNDTNVKEISNLKDQVKRYQSQVYELESIIQNNGASSSGSSMKAALDKLRTANSIPAAGLGKSSGIFFTPVKKHEWKGEECRVAAHSEWSNAFVISHKFNQLVNSGLSKSLGGFGIRIMNWLDPKKVTNLPVHQKEIRDMAFSPSQTDLLLTVGMDSKACLTNVQSALQVLHFTAEVPIWSCAFSTTDSNLIYAGLGNGQIMIYDIRKPKESVEGITFPQDKTPVCRTHFVGPSYQQSGFCSSGLLVQKLTTCWFVEFPGQGETSFHQLPFEGGFLGIDYEPATRHVLVSTRPTPKTPTRHMVCEMTQHRYEGSGAAFGCNVVKTYTGGSMMGKMYRPKIFSPVEGKVYVAGTRTANEVNMWDVSEDNLKQTFRVNNAVLDFIPVKHNDNYYMNFLNSDGLETYKY